MTKFFSRVFAIAALAVLSSTLYAQTAGIAVVDVQAAMLNTDYAKALIEQKNSEPEIAKLNSTFQALRADLQALASEAQANATTWSAEQMEESNKQMQYMNADLQLAGQKLEAEQQQMLFKIQNDLSVKATIALEQLVQAEGVTLLLDRNAALFADPSLDLTAKLVAKLNEPSAE